jgi:hypothetical protein
MSPADARAAQPKILKLEFMSRIRNHRNAQRLGCFLRLTSAASKKYYCVLTSSPPMEASPDHHLVIGTPF